MVQARPGDPTPADRSGAPTGRPGAVVAGRYRLDEPRSAALPGAQRWSATDQILARPVTVTLVTGDRTSAVLDAARRAALVVDPRLARILDVGQSDGTGYVVSAAVEGRTLADLAGRAPLGADQARAVVGEAAGALEAARRRGVHHLALRPESVVVTADGRVVLEGLAVDGELIGAATGGAHAMSRADTVGLVRVLYAALTGRWPATSAATGPAPLRSFEEWSAARSAGPAATDGSDAWRADLPAAPEHDGAPLPPVDLLASVPADLDTLCAVTLGPHDDGPHSPAELVRELEPWRAVRADEIFRAADAGRWPALPDAPAPGTTGTTTAPPTGSSPMSDDTNGTSPEPTTPTPDPATRTGSATAGAAAAGAASGAAAGGAAAVAGGAAAAGVARQSVRSAFGGPQGPGTRRPGTPPPAIPTSASFSPAPGTGRTSTRPTPEVPAPDTAAPTDGGPPAIPPARSGAAAEPAVTATPTTPTPAPDAPRPADLAVAGITSAAADGAPAPAAPTEPPAPASSPATPVRRSTSALGRTTPAATATTPATGTAVTDAAPQVTAPAAAAAPAGAAGTPAGDGPGRPDWDLPFSAEQPGDQPGRQRFDPTRWVLGAVAIAVVIGVVIAVGNVFKPFRSDDGTAQSTPAVTATAPPAEAPADGGGDGAAEPAPATAPPVVVGVNSIDPSDGDGEHEELVGRITDGDPATTWYTHTYNRADFAGFKDAVGLVITLQAPATVSSITIDGTGTGGNVEVRSTDAANPTAGDVLAGGALASPQTVLTLAQPTETQSIVLWFTSLSQTPDGANKIEISGIAVS